MSEDSIYDVLVLNTSVRRIDDDSDSTSATATDLDVYADGRPVKTRLSRWAQVIAHFLAPGGQLVFADFHPVIWMFDDDFQAIIKTLGG